MSDNETLPEEVEKLSTGAQQEYGAAQIDKLEPTSVPKQDKFAKNNQNPPF